MDNLSASNSHLSLAPLGAGDLIDRAVRLYRKNFWTFIWIAAPPVLIGTLVSILWRMLGLSLFSPDAVNNPVETDFYYFFLYIGSLLIWLVEIVVGFTVMGGASRNFVRHLLFGEPMTFRETYRNVRTRVFGLLGASTLIIVMLGLIGFIVLLTGFGIAFVAILIAIAAFSFSTMIATVVSVALGVAIMLATGWLFFLIAGNFMYVPQAMLVEGQSFGKALGRSSALARGNALRVYALFGFTILAIYSALALLFVPLGWYAWVEGIDIVSFSADAVPAWYEIASQFIGQASLILLMPVWMIGLCLLYVDERVRHEGYDIELMAARRLGEIPAVPKDFINPLQPALSPQTRMPDQPVAPIAPVAPAAKKSGSGSVLGLD